MLFRPRFAALTLYGLSAYGQPTVAEILSRVAEEAEVLRQNAPRTVTTEILEQRAVLPPSRFRPRTGTLAAESPRVRISVREVVSEYTVGSLRESDSRNLLEFRQLVAVDGRPLRTVEGARHALSLGMQSSDDRIRKRMLEEFASLGLVDIATDYGLILLAFTRRGQADMRIEPAGASRIGVEDALVLRWRQTSAAGGQLEFRGRNVARRAMEGRLWVRQFDGLPMRIQAWVEHKDVRMTIRNEASVDYTLSTHGFLTPASVVHRHIVDGRLVTENLYRYEPFKLFSTATEIRFTELPDPAALPGLKKK
jgi:hypothetical protein